MQAKQEREEDIVRHGDLEIELDMSTQKRLWKSERIRAYVEEQDILPSAQESQGLERLEIIPREGK